MVTRRKSMPSLPATKTGTGGNAKRISKFINPPISTDTAVTSSHELETLVNEIQEKFREKTRNQSQLAEAKIEQRVGRAIELMEEKVRIYEQLNVDELEKLKKSLDIIRVERSEQVIQFQARFRELKGSAKTIIKRIKQHDMDYERLVSGFFNAIEQVDCLHGGISLDDFSKIEKKDRFKLKRIDRRI